jgi:endonuclease/exonuclease/phosphatase family metal-dependent hydrolase
MTFNIRGATVEDGVNHWKNRAVLNVKVLQKYAPDLIGFQEMERENLEMYQARLPEFSYHLGPTCNRPGRILYNAIFWREAAFEALGRGGFYLSQTPAIWSADWGSARVRAAAWVKLRCTESGMRLLHLNTHLDHMSQMARLKGSQLIISKINQLQDGALDTIVTGDFNSPPKRSTEPFDAKTPYNVFIEQGYCDIYLAAGNQDTQMANTFHGFEGQQFSLDNRDDVLRLDWILILNGSHALLPTACLIIRDGTPPLYPSDHYPVLAHLKYTH